MDIWYFTFFFVKMLFEDGFPIWSALSLSDSSLTTTTILLLAQGDISLTFSCLHQSWLCGRANCYCEIFVKNKVCLLFNEPNKLGLGKCFYVF